MSMVTQCPACATTFRVNSQQLQAQRGLVRCGRCATVFDGFKGLASLPDAAPVAAAEAATPAVHDDIPSQPPQAISSPPELAPELPPVNPAAPPAAVPPAEIPVAPVETAPRRREIPPPPTQLEPAAETYAVEPPPRKRSGLWAFGIFVLLIALAAQGVYFYRSEIAAYVPEARPYLNLMCKHLRCTVALPQRPRAISIEASDMQALDPANPGVIALTATLRNHAPTALGYPALDVVLTNTREHTVARRVFLPAEYLDAGKDARTGIPPNAEITVKLDIDSGDLGAAGFRLDLLAAPSSNR
jgi:predicted Zn finger-like uncharacterized protein